MPSYSRGVPRPKSRLKVPGAGRPPRRLHGCDLTPEVMKLAEDRDPRKILAYVAQVTPSLNPGTDHPGHSFLVNAVAALIEGMSREHLERALRDASRSRSDGGPGFAEECRG